MPMKTKEETMSFGARLAALRKAAGFTQQELANEVGTSRRMIAYCEGQTAHPPTTLLPAIATALRITTDELLAGTSETHRQVEGHAAGTALAADRARAVEAQSAK